MSQKSLSGWLKAAIIAAGLCALAVYAVIIPSYGVSIVSQYPEFEYRFLPWLLFLCGTALPVYAVLVIGWLIARDVGNDRSFRAANAKRLKWCAILAAADSAYFFIGNAALLLCNCSHPGVMILSMLVVMAGVAVSVIFAALSHLVGKAADLQEQSDLTV